MLDHKLEPEAVRRLEVISGTGRRRRFSEDDKARIVEETLAPGAVISQVARQHGLSPQQLFGWRRQARQPEVSQTDPTSSLFVPAVVTNPVPEPTARRISKRVRVADLAPGMIEVEINGVTVRVGRGAEAKTVAAVLRALKAGA